MKWVGYFTPDYKRKKNHCPVSLSWHSTTVYFRRTCRWNYSGRHWASSTLGRPNNQSWEIFTQPELAMADKAIKACRSCILSIWADSRFSVLERRHFNSCPFASVSQSTAYVDAEQPSLHSMLESLDTRKSSITEYLATGKINVKCDILQSMHTLNIMFHNTYILYYLTQDFHAYNK